MQNGPKYSIGLKTQYGQFASNKNKKDGLSPGPGQYQSTSSQMSKTIAYTFGVKTPVNGGVDKRMEIPGPGQYNTIVHNIDNNRVGTGFGTQKRAIGASMTASSTSIPGPGQYTVDRELHGPKVGFGTAKRDGSLLGSSHLLVPGPGQYNKEEPIGKNGPKVSMKFRPSTANSLQ